MRKQPNVTELHKHSRDEVGTHPWRPSHRASCSGKSQSCLLRAVSIALSPGMNPPQLPWATCPGFCPLEQQKCFFQCLNGISLPLVLSLGTAGKSLGSVFSTPFLHALLRSMWHFSLPRFQRISLNRRFSKFCVSVTLSWTFCSQSCTGLPSSGHSRCQYNVLVPKMKILTDLKWYDYTFIYPLQLNFH